MATIDAVLAATALAYDLTMVARNVSDFQQAGFRSWILFAVVMFSSTATGNREA